MNDNAQQPTLSTKLYNALLRATTTCACDERGHLIYTTAPSQLDPAVIRRAVENGSIYHFRIVGPKSVAQIKRWLDDLPTTEPEQPTCKDNTITTDPTIAVERFADIIASLERRGFLNLRELRSQPNCGSAFDIERVQTQLDAVLEELGETARLLRRHRQARESINPAQLATETADVLIAAVCLFVTAAGNTAPATLTAKLATDEARGWLHSGLTREQYEHRSQS